MKVALKFNISLVIHDGLKISAIYGKEKRKEFLKNTNCFIGSHDLTK